MHNVRGRSQIRLQEEGGRWSKKSTFSKLLYLRICKRREVGGQKKPNLVNIVCERPLVKSANFEYFGASPCKVLSGF